MPRPYSRDIPMQRMPTPEPDAIRSYSSRRGSAFIISCLVRGKNSREGAWRVTHQPSGGYARVWSYRECIELIRKLTSAPRRENDRFVILARGDRYGQAQGQVLLDRASGSWWKRGFMTPVTNEQLEVMSALRPIAAVSAFQAFQLSLSDQQHAHALSPNVDVGAPVRRGRPALTMEERVERWQAKHVPRPHARHGQRQR